ncbi:ATP-dependent RecD-like DNA helicase [Ruminococcaceae bacterium OttesenSCG-928-L11]|nr:ATP-dependent RecD-like DNA helicase [Ruminococcaceae bacterium OttesenSCG-928-L11]
MERLRCVVERITYQNEDNGYSVLKVRAKGFLDLVTVVGSMAAVNMGSVLLLSGEWKVDAKYGRQFAASAWEEKLPATVMGIERYLGSGMIKGIGPKFARRIVEKFGTDTLDVIEQTPDKLIEVGGIGKRRVAAIKKAWDDQKEVKNIMLFLQEHKVSTTHAVKIFKTYAEKSIEVVKENPYRLADDIWGIGFKTADGIAMKMGFEKDGYFRCRSGLLYVLNEFANNGHCYAPREELLEKAVAMLEIDKEKLSQTIDQMLRENDLHCEAPDNLYLMPFYFSEKGVAERFQAIMGGAVSAADADWNQQIAEAERESGIQYDEIQRDAIKTALSSKVMVLTGGPGTGKTTTTRGIITLLTAQGCDILLAAPTGRAAKRLSEATGMEAKTIHRLLGFSPAGGYERNADNPLEGDVLLVDESSMIDVILMYNLLKAVPDTMKLILVGDSDQLPSVGAGNVLLDIIASGVVPVVKLTTIYRQAQTSNIIMNAHRINKGEFPVLRGGKRSDFFFIEEEDPQNIPSLICELCAKRLPGYYKVSPTQGIQVLSPMQRGETGAANLNALLQEALNPGAICLRRGGIEYRLGDKVMQLKNNYDKEVFNGDIGQVDAVDLEERELTVLFDGNPVVYDVSELDELVLAYATTIHKAQGSEYPVVVIPFTMQHFMMLQRNLLYTGVTRAKKALVLVGTKKAIGYAVRNNTVTKRNTGLTERLQAALTASPAL